jgi:hypothetical protein
MISSSMLQKPAHDGGDYDVAHAINRSIGKVDVIAAVIQIDECFTSHSLSVELVGYCEIGSRSGLRDCGFR